MEEKKQTGLGTNSGGGVVKPKPMDGYQKPKGPTTIDNPKSPGLHGSNSMCGSQGKH